MLPYILTGLAGVVLGIVAARAWLMRDATPAPVSGEAAPQTTVAGNAPKCPISAIALIAAAILAIVSVAVIALRGEEPAGPAVTAGALTGSTVDAAAAPKLDDVDVMIDRLARRLESAPNDGEGFRMLGWSYVNTNKPDKAVAAYKRALELLPKRADVNAGYGEALADVAGGTVTAEAKAAFDRAIALDPKEPRARYFQALYRSQHGDKKGALDAWIALANDGPADAPWQADLQKRINETASALGVDVSGRLKLSPLPKSLGGEAPQIDAATAAAASAMPATDRQAMIDKMVEGLAQKLAANPADADGWVRLLRSRMVLKQSDQAAKDLVTARRALAKAPEGLAQVNAAARDLGVPGN